MNRYLVNFAYIGTKFKTFAKNVKKGNEVDNTSVEGALEIALKSLKPVNPVKLHTSSRTDAGVHALHSTLHVDLERKNGRPYDNEHVTASLNKLFKESDLDLTVHSVERVPRQFDAKHNPISRTYLYRLAIRRISAVTWSKLSKFNRQLPLNSEVLPIEEIDRCHFLVTENFDIEKAKAVAPLLVGKHDFRSFMSTNNELKTKQPAFAVRRINSIEIAPGKPLAVQRDERFANVFEYWNIRITGKSFVYRQIRRIIGVLIAAAEGKMTQKDVYEMLTIPSKHSWRSGIKVVPAHGLYLVQVEYSMESKLLNTCDEPEKNIE